MQQWKLNSARAIGLSHIEDQIPCQDNVITREENGVSVAVLSDGCGSAPYSHEGSQLVVNTVSEFLCKYFDKLYMADEDIIKKSFAQAILNDAYMFTREKNGLINKYFETDEGKRYYNKVSNYEIMSLLSEEDAQRLLYTTLLDATVLFVAIKGEKCLIGHCGDGFILGFRNGNFEIVSEESKIGERNETNYPSSVFFMSKAYKDESLWDLFRIQKIEAQSYLGFTLMSDGAEKSLVSIKKEGSLPVKKNNELLYEIVSNETPKDAHKYLTELLEQVYREMPNSDGDMVEITDDDVSVALMVSSLYIPTNSEEKSVEKPQNTVLDIMNKLPKKMFYEAKLKKLLSVKKELSQSKFERLDKIFRYSIAEYMKDKYNVQRFEEILQNYFKLDKEDVLFGSSSSFSVFSIASISLIILLSVIDFPP